MICYLESWSKILAPMHFCQGNAPLLPEKCCNYKCSGITCLFILFALEKHTNQRKKAKSDVIPHKIIGTLNGWYGSGGKTCRRAVGGLPVRSHPGRVEVSLSKIPNPQLLLTSWLVPYMAANRRWCVNGWMRGIKALYKCSPFTI